jgi:hypothetical protein
MRWLRSHDHAKLAKLGSNVLTVAQFAQTASRSVTSVSRWRRSTQQMAIEHEASRGSKPAGE